MKLFASGVIGVLFFAANARAAEPDALTVMAQHMADQINGDPKGFTPWFAPSFLQAVPEAQLAGLFKSLHTKYGPVLRVVPAPTNTANSGKFDFIFTDVQIPATLTIEASPPGRVIGYFLGNPVPRLHSLDDVTAKLAALPGDVSFQLQSLDDGKTLQSLHGDRALAIGSAFKLYILAALVQQKIPWDQVVRIEDRYKSLPSGDMRDFPAGAPVTVHTLALAMISKSDNTAADHLLALVGRDKVQAAQGVCGMKNPAANLPFVSTLELFRLKADAGLAKEYLAADVAGRNALLTRVAGAAKPDVLKLVSEKPMDIEHLEWFASSADLCRVMAWLDGSGDATARAILAVNPGLAISTAKYPFIGFKGGSEPGVLNLTWLLKSAAGHRYALAATWNNREKDVDLEQFAGLLQAAIDMVEAPATQLGRCRAEVSMENDRGP